MKTQIDKTQKKIVRTQGNLLVIARAGSGKTTTIVARAEWLKEKNKNILFLNVRKRTNREILNTLDYERVDHTNMEKRTFHSFAMSVLNHQKGVMLKSLPECYFDKAFYKIPNEINIIDEKDCNKILKDISKELNTGYSQNELKKMFTEYIKRIKKNKSINGYYLKNKLLGIDKGKVKVKRDFLKKETFKIFKKFQQDNFSLGRFTFEDSLILAEHLFRTIPSISDHYAKSYPFILVDEFQDVNQFQFKILKSLGKSGSEISVFGDPCQTVNEFMGAERKVFKNYRKFFNVEEFSLDKSYRLTPCLAKVANAIARQMKYEGITDIEGANRKSKNFKPKSFTSQHSERMVGLLIKKVKFLIKVKNVNPSKFLICYKNAKNNKDLNDLKKGLTNFDIKYIQVPILKHQLELAQKIIEKIKKEEGNLKDRIKKVFEKIENIDDKKKSFFLRFKEWMKRYDNLEDMLFDWVDDFEHYLLESNKDSVILSTIHSCKGSTFESVFILDSSELQFSEKMRLTKSNKNYFLSLLYVAMTRSNERLGLFFPKTRKESQFLSPLLKADFMRTSVV